MRFLASSEKIPGVKEVEPSSTLSYQYSFFMSILASGGNSNPDAESSVQNGRKSKPGASKPSCTRKVILGLVLFGLGGGCVLYVKGSLINRS